jgi:hypothetical protein
LPGGALPGFAQLAVAHGELLVGVEAGLDLLGPDAERVGARLLLPLGRLERLQQLLGPLLHHLLGLGRLAHRLRRLLQLALRLERPAASRRCGLGEAIELLVERLDRLDERRSFLGLAHAGGVSHG